MSIPGHAIFISKKMPLKHILGISIMTSKLLTKYNLKKFPYRINWEITRICNFQCSYCINNSTDKTTIGIVHSPQKIADFFTQTNKEWLILITGGEPFTYPQFVDVCVELSKKNHIQITTNLSSPDIYDFADKVDPNKVFMISASYHFMEREKLDLINDFKNKCIYLKNKGFKIVVNYIAHPSTLDRLENELLEFSRIGIESFVLIFRGLYNGCNYPESYTDEEMSLITKYILDEKIELSSAYGKLNYYGRYCEAGVNYFFLNPKGEISRCSTLQKPIGNLFNRTFKFDKKLKPCIACNCNDVYCGDAAISDKKANFFKIWLEKRSYYKKFN